MEFQKWPSIPRLSKEKAVVTEKLNGTNSCIRIHPLEIDTNIQNVTAVIPGNPTYGVWAQSRSRFLKPGKATDNFGFAGWVFDNTAQLINILGPGDHYGEWWGSKIQQSYGMTNGERRFSLFNALRWAEAIDIFPGSTEVKALCTVPVLYFGPMLCMDLDALKSQLRLNGSYAAPGHDAEGMVVYLREVNAIYKILLENDDIHKWEVK